MLKTVFMVFGFLHVVCFVLGALGLFHYRVYIGVKDVIYIPKEEYEQLKAKHGASNT